MAPVSMFARDAAAVVGLAVAWTALRGIDHSYVSFSDGVYLYLAREVAAQGPSALYERLVSSQPPLPVLGAAAVWKLAPSVEAVRVALAVVAGLTALVSYALARRVGIGSVGAIAVAAVTLAAPMRAQFTALDGDALLAPFAVGLALAVLARRWWLVGAIVGVGLLVKATWLLFVVAALVLAARAGARALARVTLSSLAVAAIGGGTMMLAWSWDPARVAEQVLLAQRSAGLQLDLLPGVVLIALLLWWPLLVAAVVARPLLPRAFVVLLVAGCGAIAYTAKEGTFFNVLAAAEPLLAVAAVAGIARWWLEGARLARAGAVALVAALAVQAASLAMPGTVPFPIGASYYERPRNERLVDGLAHLVAEAARHDEPVLVNPFIAVVAERDLVGGQSDWFILHALERRCAAAGEDRGRCDDWEHLVVRARRAPVVSVDRNVVRWDPEFDDRVTAGRHRLAGADAPPLQTRLYGR